MNDLQKLILAGGFLLLSGGIVLLAFDRFGSNAPIRFLNVERNENEVQKAERQLTEADEYLRQNSAESARKALDLFNSVLSRNLGERINQMSRYGLGMALEKLDDNAAALEHYRGLKTEQDKLSQDLRDKVDYSLGRLLLVINHETEGRSLLEALLARTNDGRLKSRIHTAFGQFYLARGDRRRAGENFNIALKYFPENLQAEIGRANAASGVRRSMYYEYYDEYLTGNSHLAPADRRNRTAGQLRDSTYEAGIRAYRQGRYQEAVDLFARVIRDGGDNGETEKARYWTGEALHASGRTTEAYNTFERVLSNATSSMDQPALVRMGMILYQQGRLQDALNKFYRASEDYPNGSYTNRALEWRKETEAQLKEKDFLRNYDEQKRDEKLPPVNQSQAEPASERSHEREEDRVSDAAPVRDESDSTVLFEVDGKTVTLSPERSVR
jgi:tetratricopeptide (TPR) repeat protein